VIEHVETPNPLNPLGVKGAGEGGTIPAPAAIIAAIEDALSPFGVHFAEMPLTPARIVAALHEAGAHEKLNHALRRPAETTATIVSDAGGPCSSIQDGRCGRGCRGPPFRRL
jgi:hypothetical protein